MGKKTKVKLLRLSKLFIGGPVEQRLEPLIEMFRLDEKMLAYAKNFTRYCVENFAV